MSKKMFYATSMFFVFIILGMLNSGKSAAYGYNSASGNISFEVDNPADFYKEVQKIAVKYRVQTANYNTYIDSKTKKQRITATYKLSITSSAIFMSELSSLGNIKSQNYNDNPNYDYYSQSETKLSNLKKEKEKLSSSVKSVPLTIELIDREIQNLTNQVNSQKANLNLANISVTIGETGSFDYQGDLPPAKKYETKKTNYFNILLIALVILVIFLVIFNLFTIKKYLRR